MFTIRPVKFFGVSALAVLAQLVLAAAPAAAQVSVSAGLDTSPDYMFRGIRQNSRDTGDWAWWPYVDLGFAMFEGDGRLKSLDLNIGTWGSLHTEQDGVYEADVYAALGFGFGRGVALGTTYTSYTSPNDSFTHVKEVSLSLSAPGTVLRPYLLLAFEMSAEPGKYQADGGEKAGKYLELGIEPGYGGERVLLSFPIKVGLSVGDYYELDGTDNEFGFFGVGAAVAVPVGSHWDVHGGVQVQLLGDTTKAINNGNGSQATASVGIGLLY